MFNFIKKPITTSFAPNIQDDDVTLALQQVLSLIFKSQNNQSISALKNWFCSYYQVKHCFVFSSGRAALYYLLKSLNLEPGSEVVIQSLTCVAVPNSIIWSGLKPVYVDVDKKTLNMDIDDLRKKISQKTKAIIIQHTFGIPAEIKMIKQIANRNNLILIEDCAHSLGGTYQGQKLGSFGDVAFFSFGRDKIVSSVFGGAIVTKNSSLAKKLAICENKLKKTPKSFLVKQLLFNPIYYFSLLLYPIIIGKIIIKLCFKINLLSKAVYNEEKIGKMPQFINYQFSPFLAKLALNQLLKIDEFNQHRRQIADIYTKLIKSDNFGDEITIFLRYPILLNNKNYILAQAKKNGIYLGDWYSTPITPIKTDFSAFYYKHGSCPNAEGLVYRLINLPTHINIKPDDAKKMCTFINSISFK